VVVPFGLALSFDQWMYLFALLVPVAAFALAANLLRGRIGLIYGITLIPVAALLAGWPLRLGRAR